MFLHGISYFPWVFMMLSPRKGTVMKTKNNKLKQHLTSISLFLYICNFEKNKWPKFSSKK